MVSTSSQGLNDGEIEYKSYTINLISGLSGLSSFFDIVTTKTCFKNDVIRVSSCVTHFDDLIL